MDKKFTALLILDGYGLAPEAENNAINSKTSPYVQSLIKDCPFTELEASGLSVGLPEGQMGNSEVGHLNIGAGRVIYQELTRISKSIKDGDFFTNPSLVKAMQNCIDNNKNLHLMGLLSDGGVHSHTEHLFALIKMAKSIGVKNTYIHCFLDGRDVAPNSGKAFMQELVNKIEELQYGKIATVTGRFYAMDRDNNWARVAKAYTALTEGVGEIANNAITAIETSYAKGVFDEFVLPTIIQENGKAVATINANDSIIFYNFRPDRARMISKCFIAEDFSDFERKTGFLKPLFVSMTMFDATFSDKLLVAYDKEFYNNTLGEYLSANGITQLRIAETQKYAHVTYFFNGGDEKQLKGEDRVLISSPKVETFDLKPEMSAYEVCDKAIECINENKYQVMVLNFANCDMVGHTGIMKATQLAVTAVDNCVKRLIEKINSIGGQVLITADHGNADVMFEMGTNAPFTAHTTNKVPFIYVGSNPVKFKNGGMLADIAPTMLDLMNIEIPKEMTGKSLLDK